MHFRKLHKGTSKKLYTLLYRNGIEPTCGCGCGGEVKYLDMSRGFREFVRGHAACVSGKNNWGNNKKAQEKSQKTRNRMWKEGELRIWNKGLTKEDHSSVAQYGVKGSETISSNSEELKVRAERMKKGRLNGTVPTLYGPEHSQWKGGISSLYEVSYSNTKLYKEWKYPLLAAAQFKCKKCKSPKNLHVHHDKENFSTILKTVAEENNWEYFISKSIHPNNDKMFNLKIHIAEQVADYHIKNNVSGLVLCSECHKKEHPNLNF